MDEDFQWSGREGVKKKGEQEVDITYLVYWYEIQSIMKHIWRTILYSVFPLIVVHEAHGQEAEHADEYIRMAEDFRKALRPDSAIICYEKAASEFQKVGNTEKFVHAYNQIGAILTRQDDYVKSRHYLERALSAGRASLDSNSLVIATTYLNLGVNYSGEGNYGQSIEYHNRALAIRLLKLGECHADVATSYGNIGNVYFNSKDFTKAVEAHSRAMQIREVLFGSSGVEVIQSYNNLGNAYRELGDYPTSLAYFERALLNKTLQLGEEHKDLAKFYRSMSEVCYLMGNKAQGDIYRIKSEDLAKS